MERLETFIAKFPELTKEEKLEVISHQWLFAHAPEPSRARAMERLDSLLERNGVDAPTAMRTIRDVAKNLQKAIEERLAAVRRIES